MRTIKKRTLKPFLFACLSLTVVTIAFANAPFSVASPPGKPEAINIWGDRCTLQYLPPISNGGSPVTGFIIEGMNIQNGRWGVKGSSQALFYYFNYGIRGATYKFRVFAENAAGLSKPSLNSNPITFSDPY